MNEWTLPAHFRWCQSIFSAPFKAIETHFDQRGVILQTTSHLGCKRLNYPQAGLGHYDRLLYVEDVRNTIIFKTIIIEGLNTELATKTEQKKPAPAQYLRAELIITWNWWEN